MGIQFYHVESGFHGEILLLSKSSRYHKFQSYINPRWRERLARAKSIVTNQAHISFTEAAYL